MANNERTFEGQGTSGKKFWAISRERNTLTIRFGKVGTRGSSRQSNFADEHAAESEMRAVITSKLQKGYVETTGKAPSVGKPGPQAFSTASSFAAPPQPRVTTSLPATPQPSGPRFMGFDLADDEPMKLRAHLEDDHQYFRVDDLYEHDTDGNTLYRDIECSFPTNEKWKKARIVVRTPFIYTMQNERAAFEFGKKVFEKFASDKRVTIHRVLDTKEVKVVIKEEGAQHEFTFMSTFRRGDTITRWYERMGNELERAAKDTSFRVTIG